METERIYEMARDNNVYLLIAIGMFLSIVLVLAVDKMNPKKVWQENLLGFLFIFGFASLIYWSLLLGILGTVRVFEP